MTAENSQHYAIFCSESISLTYVGPCASISMTLVTVFILVLCALVDMAPWLVAYSTGYGPRYCTLLCIQHGTFVAVTEVHRACM